MLYNFKHIEQFYTHKSKCADTVTTKYNMEDNAILYFNASNLGTISRSIGWPSIRELRNQK